jgi:predicted DNA-binding protein with PD1-like motif
MQATQVSKHSPETYVLVFETGDEVIAVLERFALENMLKGSSFTAIGALSDIEVGWLDWETKQYETAVDLQEQVEVLSLIGDVALSEGKPVVHAHIVIGKRDGSAHGGHLLRAHVRPTLELVLVEWPKHLCKQFDPSSRLALIRP